MWGELIGGVQQGVAGPPQPQNLGNPTAGGMDMAVNGLGGGLVKGAPKTPEEVEVRKGQWSQVLDQITKDPDMMSTLMFMGTRMMQPLQQGQTVGGQLGNTMAEGMQYLGGRQEQARKREMEDKEFGLKERKGNADIRQSEAGARNTEASAQRTEMETAEFERTQLQRDSKRDLELQKLEGDIKANDETRDLRAIERKIALMEQEIKIAERSEALSPVAVQQRARLNELKVKAEEARIAASNASTAAARAQAAKYGQPDKLSVDEQMIQDFVADETWAPAQGITNTRTRRRLAQEHVSQMKKSPGSESGVIQNHRYFVEDLRKQGYPEDVLSAYATQVMNGMSIPPPPAGATPTATAEKPAFGAPPKLLRWEDRDRLVKPGQSYVGPDGKRYTRPL